MPISTCCDLTYSFKENWRVSFAGGRLKISSYTVNDVVLLKMDKEISFTRYVQPICLPNQVRIDYYYLI